MENIEKDRQVALYLLFILFIHIFNSYQVLLCIIFGLFKRVKLIDCQLMCKLDPTLIITKLFSQN